MIVINAANSSYFRGEQNDYNLMLHLKNTHVFIKFGRKLFGCPPPGCGPDYDVGFFRMDFIRNNCPTWQWLYRIKLFSVISGVQRGLGMGRTVQRCRWQGGIQRSWGGIQRVKFKKLQIVKML